MAPTSPGNCSSNRNIALAAFLSQADSGTSSSLAAEPGDKTGAAGLICWAPDGLNCARCSRLNLCTNNLSWADETSGSQACVWRVVASMAFRATPTPSPRLHVEVSERRRVTHHKTLEHFVQRQLLRLRIPRTRREDGELRLGTDAGRELRMLPEVHRDLRQPPEAAPARRSTGFGPNSDTISERYTRTPRETTN